MFRVTRCYRFSCSHRLHSPALSDMDNNRIYGKCNNPFGHGHDYVLRVTACGPASAAGHAVAVPVLDGLVEREILRELDHRNLNVDVDWFAREVPTSENLAAAICRRLKQQWKTAFADQWPRLERICIEETPRNIFQVNADEIE